MYRHLMYMPETRRWAPRFGLILGLSIAFAFSANAPSYAEIVSSNLSNRMLAVVGNSEPELVQELHAALATFSTADDRECLQRLKVCTSNHDVLPPAEIMLAMVYCDANDVDGAREVLKQAEHAHSRHPAFLLTLARINAREQHVPEALALFERATLGAEKSNWESDRIDRFVLGCQREQVRLLESSNMWERTLDLLTELVNQESVTSIDPSIPIRYARALFFSGQQQEAQRELESRIPDDAPILLAQWFNEIGDRDSAERILRRVAASTKKPVMVITLANYLLDANKLTDAQAAIAALTAKTEDGPAISDDEVMKQLNIEYARNDRQRMTPEVQTEVSIVQARIAMLQGNWTRAAFTLQPEYESNPENIRVANLYARALISSDDGVSRARGIDLAYSKATRYRDNVDCLETLSWAQVFNDESLEAKEHLLKQAQSNEISADAAYILARALAENGNLNAAKTLTQRALAADSPFDLRAHANQWLSGDSQIVDSQIPIPSPDTIEDVMSTVEAESPEEGRFRVDPESLFNSDTE